MPIQMDKSATSKVVPKRARLRFERLPSTYIHPLRLGHCLPPGLPVNFRDQLLRASRVQQRLSIVLARKFGLSEDRIDDLNSPAGRFALLEGEQLGAAVRRIGAIWHWREISAVILAEPLRQLIIWLGRDNHRASLDYRSVGTVDEDEPDDHANHRSISDAPDIEDLCRAIERDGLRCLNAWCGNQPATLAARLRLKLPPVPEVEEEPHGPYRTEGLVIVDRVVSSLMGGGLGNR